MTVALRALLIVGALLILVFFIRKIRKSQLKINEAVFWFIFALCLVILGVFPQIAFALCHLIGIQSPANFVWLCLLALLLVRSFMSAVEISQLRSKITALTQEIALEQAEGDGEPRE